MIVSDNTKCSVGFSVNNDGSLEDLVNILFNSGYWVRLKRYPCGDRVMVEIKEDNK